MFMRTKEIILAAVALFFPFILLIRRISWDSYLVCDFQATFPSQDDIRNLPHHPIDVKNLSEMAEHIQKPDCKLQPMENKHSVLILVKSRAWNTNLREIIRSTWGKHLPSYVCLKFILGYEETVQYEVDAEFTLYGDIIQGGFVESFRYNTIKTAFMFNFIVTYCQHVDLILFLNDDVVVDILQFLEYVDGISLNGNSYLYIGHRVLEERVDRNQKSYWHVPCEKYPYERWPPFLHGDAYLASKDTVTQLYNHFHLVRFYSSDEVWLGLVALVAGISHNDNLLFHATGKYKHFALFLKCTRDESKMANAWRDLKNRTIFRKLDYFNDKLAGAKTQTF